MALFKIFRGEESLLEKVPKHDGYAYFTSDEGNLYIDVGSDPDGQRIQVNAFKAVKLDNGETAVEIDDIVLKTTIEDGALALGGSEEEGGLTGLKGVGALFSETEGAPTFGTLPLTAGGTGAQTAAGARQSLDVYDKQTVDTNIGKASTRSYYKTLTADGWTSEGEEFTQILSIPELRCGTAGNVPPIITYETNLDEYSTIEKADATVGQGIKFTVKEKPESEIKIIIIDVA